jgi:hypothetical protein
MYKRLLWLLVFSVCSVLIIFIVNGTLLLFFDLKSMQQYYWKYKWISLEGLLQILYFVVFVGILLLWKPTEHNARYGLQQISQDEDEALDLEVRLHSFSSSKTRRTHKHVGNGVGVGVLEEEENADFIVGFELNLSEDDDADNEEEEEEVEYNTKMIKRA